MHGRTAHLGGRGMKKKWISVLIALVVVIGSAAILTTRNVYAADYSTTTEETGSCGTNLTYTVLAFHGDSDIVTYTVQISGTGEMDDYTADNHAPWQKYSSSLTSVILESGVTSVGAYAFDACPKLSVNIRTPYTLTAIGDCAFKEGCSNSYLSIPSSVKTIGADAFMNCSSITQVTIGSGVESIQPGAFRLCSALLQITVNSGNTHYAIYKDALYSADFTELVCYPYARGAGSEQSPYAFNQNLTRIDDYAFEGCQKLIGPLQLPGKLESVGKNAFSSCTGFTGAIVLPDSLTTIGESAFYVCSQITSLTVPAGVTAIPKAAFEGMRKLSSVTLPDGLASIGEKAFSGCTVLTDIDIPETVTSLGSSAFSECPALTAAYFEGNAPDASADLFSGAASGFTVYYRADRTGWSSTGWNGCADSVLSSICVLTAPQKDEFYPGDRPDTYGLVLTAAYQNGHTRSVFSHFTSSPETLTEAGQQPVTICYGGLKTSYPVTVLEAGTVVQSGSIGSLSWLIDSNGVFYLSGTGPMTSAPTSSNLSSVKTICIGTGVTTIADHAFSACTKASGRLLLPGTVTAIGQYAFCNCSKITSVAIPGTVKKIGDYAFEYCTSLAGELWLPEGLQSIGMSGFGGCSSLTKVHIPASVTSIGGSAFSGLTSLTAFEVAPGGYSFDTDENGILYGRDYSRTPFKSLLFVPIARALHDLTIPDTVTSIASFEGCKNITGYIKVPSINYIYTATFRYCTGLESIILSEGTTRLESYAFEGCTSLTSVTIPSTVTELGQGVFLNCTKLKAVFFRGMAAPTRYGDNRIFSGCADNLKIYYPAGATGWDSIPSDGPDLTGKCSTFTASATVECEFSSSSDVPTDVAVSFPKGVDPTACTVILAYYKANGQLLGMRSADARNEVYSLDINGYHADRVKVITVTSGTDVPQASAGVWDAGSNG